MGVPPRDTYTRHPLFDTIPLSHLAPMSLFGFGGEQEEGKAETEIVATKQRSLEFEDGGQCLIQPVAAASAGSHV